MHGPGSRTPTNALGWEPVYPAVIEVVDDVVKGLPYRRRSWRTARIRALTKWEQAGLVFSITEGPGEMYEAGEPWIYGEVAVPYLIPGSIRLLRYGLPGKPSFGWYQKEKPAALAVYAPETLTQEWLKRYNRPTLAALIAHEVGHCLGLWHREKAIMGGGWNPDEHDLDSLRSYYL